MILEELTGDAVISINRDGKTIALKVGDSFTDDEYYTRTIYGESGKATIRIDQNATIEIGAQPAPVTETSAPVVKTKSQPAPAPVESVPTE
jgi:hypothetical protein